MLIGTFNGLPKLIENFPGKNNIWIIEENFDLKLASTYPRFHEELEQALKRLEANNPLSRTICQNIRRDIKNEELKYKTYARFSKWCDWNQKSSEILAKNISRILFGFDMPRLWDQNNKPISENRIKDFLDKLATKKDNMNNQPLTNSLQHVNSTDYEDISNLYEKYLKEGRIRFLTFHPSYSYEEFIEGISVKTIKDSLGNEQIKYYIRQGIFKDICKMALADAIGIEKEEASEMEWKEVFDKYLQEKDSVDFDTAARYVLIIDEINRGDMAKIFGELITLLEADKRIGQENQLIVQLPISGELFCIPPNLYIIATMNTADRSIALIDVALRRRFAFVEMNPNFDRLRKEHIEKNEKILRENKVLDLLEKSILAIEKINKRICEDPAIGRDRQIGHSFFFKVYTLTDLCLVWRNEILPLLEEYCYSDYKKLNKLLFDKEENTIWIDESAGIFPLNEDNLHNFLFELLKQ